MTDSSQGNLLPSVGHVSPASGVSSHAQLRSAALLAQSCGTRLYIGSTPTQRRRGRIRTAPRLLHALGIRTAILELPPKVYARVGCWGSDATWLMKVEVAYDLYYKRLRPAVCDGAGRGGVSKRSVMKVAAARAHYAEWETGRNSRPSVARIVRETRLSESTVQRATRMLRLLGAATEVFRGRQRTRTERFASWRVKDKGRGWASVYALHPPRNPQVVRAARIANNSVTPQPLRGPFRDPSPLGKNSLNAQTAEADRKNGRAARDTATAKKLSPPRRRPQPDSKGLLLALKWLQHPESPHWVTRHGPNSWARVLKRTAHAEWTVEDLHQLLRDHVSLGGWIAATPHDPLQLVGWLIKKHGDLEDRPAAADMAREAEFRASAAARREAIESCTRCGEDGFVLDAAGVPVEPVQRCSHDT